MVRSVENNNVPQSTIIPSMNGFPIDLTKVQGLDPTRPIVFQFYVEWTYYPDRRELWQTTCRPLGTTNKKKKTQNAKVKKAAPKAKAKQKIEL